MAGRRTAAAALVLVAACGGGGAAPPTPTPTTTTLDALGAAIDGVNATRAPVLAGVTTLVGGPRAVDAGDEVASLGRRGAAGATLAQVENGVRKRDAAATRFAADVAAYAKAIDPLEAAASAPDLGAEQAKALKEVVRTARLEHAGYLRFRTAVERTWPAYAAAVTAIRTWASRARGGWYRNDQEAADAYTVLISDHRTALDAARTTFQKADAERKVATDRTSFAVDAARRVLAVLGS